MTVIKICGITNLEDALMAIEAGADALGFNFFRPSPRYVEPQAARAIIDQLPAKILKVGVFVNEAAESVERIADSAGLSALQLHGDESPEYCRSFAGQYVIKVFATSGDFKPERVNEYDVAAVMIDAFDSKMRGGTGRISDWSIALKAKDLAPKLFLAGGLSAQNVDRAIASVKPYGVDACSALEITPGRKDPQRVSDFVKAVRSASEQ